MSDTAGGDDRPHDVDHAPALSVVLPTDTWETIRPVVERLRRQTIAARIEVVLVVPSRAAAGLERMSHDGLGAVVVVEVGALLPLARARAAGVRAASAPLVFLGETHSYPQPGWAEAVVAAAADPAFAVIVCAFGNANPTGVLSWSGFLCDYGGWQHGHAGGAIDAIPTFNSVYRSSVLRELDGRLELALGHGDALVVHLRDRGHRAQLAPGARLDHLNVAQPRAWVEERFATGRLLAANRARDWGTVKRLAYAAAFPLIGLVLSRRALSGRRRHDGAGAPRGTAAAMVAACSVKAFGEAFGYLGGGSARIEGLADEFELHKVAYAGRGSPTDRRSRGGEER